MRLIDADELMEHVWRDKLNSRELIAKMVENAPTIKEIPTKIPIDIFEQLISQKTGWIPVSSKRLPEINEWVICQCRANIYEVLKFTNYGWYHDDMHCYMDGFVIAWMPLPEPYKGE